MSDAPGSGDKADGSPAPLPPSADGDTFEPAVPVVAGPTLERRSRPLPPTGPGRTTAWLGVATTLFLATATATVAIAASPALFRLAGLDAPPPDFEAGPVRSTPGLPPLYGSHDEDGEGEPSGSDRFRLPPGLERVLPAPDTAPDEAPPMPMKSGRTRGRVKLFLERDGDEQTGEVPPQQTVMILREVGEWALVLYGAPGEATVGWARKSEIAVR